MRGVLITVVSLGLGVAVASLDEVSGLVLVVLGGLAGVAVCWIELS